MKKIIYLSLFAGLLTAGCKKSFLEVAPETNITSDNFYKNEQQFQQALVGAYAAVRDAITGEISSWVMGEMRSDNTHYDYNASDRGTQFVQREDIANFMDNSSNTVTGDKYDQCYVGISRVNSILDQLPNATFSQQSIDSIEGQALFLRALFYFELVRYFGGVSLYTTEVTTIDKAFVPRSSAEDIYKLIISDLQAAIPKLPAVAFPQSGRASQGSARTLLGHVYLTLKEYPEASTELQSVTGMGYALLPEYAQVFALANKNSVESIFEAQYKEGTQLQQSDFAYSFIPITENTAIITGIAANNKMGGWNVPTKEFIDSYEPGDKRLDVSIAVAEGTGNTPAFVVEAVKSIVGYVTPPGKVSKPFILKFLHPHSEEFNTDDNFPIYRYADALLMLAEALNEQNKSGEALPWLNEVRRRAGLGDVGITDQAQLRDIIAHERRVELAFENKRWLDLVRTGKAIEVMNNNGIYMKSLYNYLLPATYNVTEDRLLFPIPYREETIGKLEQNKGY